MKFTNILQFYETVNIAEHLINVNCFDRFHECTVFLFVSLAHFWILLVLIRNRAGCIYILFAVSLTLRVEKIGKIN